MAFIKLQFKPGVNRDQTDYSNEGGWYECDKIRFRSGYPEKLGGWQKVTDVAFSGYCRQMWNWITTYTEDFLAMGTDTKAYIEFGGNYFDITPFDTALTGSNTFAVTDTSTTVTVTTTTALPSWLVTGEPVQIAGFAAPLGGIPFAELNGVHTATVTGANSFTFVASTAATSTTSVSGAGYTVQAEIEPGNAITTAGLGWGAGTWSRGGWGTAATSSGIYLPQRDWFFDNFDNDLVMNIRNGAPYWWARGTVTDPATALATHAVTLQSYAYDWAVATSAPTYTAAEYRDAVPTKVMQMLVSQQDKHLIAFGAVPFGYTSVTDFDPMLIRWADQDTPGDWIPQVTNSAGDLRVSRGSRIVAALPSRQEILVWTDSTLYTMQFLGTTDVFALQEYADNISIMSPRAMASAANITYWMGQDKFYAYTGRVETLPCSLRDHVFNNINLGQSEQVICGTNEQWNEVWWFYPTFNSDYNDAYVVYNHLERIWYYGTLPRTAWLDTPLRHFPQAANTVGGETSGYLYNHEEGIDADGVAMESYIMSSDFDLDDGEQFMLTRRMIPDIAFAGSTATAPEVTVELRHRNFPGSALQTEDEDNARVIQTAVGQYTPQVFIRARARQMALKVISDQLGVAWQLGAPRIDARPDGKR